MEYMKKQAGYGGPPSNVMGAQMGPNVMGAKMAPYGMAPQPSPAVMGAQAAPYPGPGMGPMVSPAAMGPGPGMGPMVSPAAMGPGPFGPTGPTNVAPTQVLPTQVSPTQNFVNTNVFPHVVPHVHPTHTINVNKQVFTHQHYFPQTQSTVNQCFEQHVVCPGRPPFAPMHHKKCCPPRPFGF